MRTSTTRYEVWSEHVTEDREVPATTVHELTRTERGVAVQDVEIIQTILHRKAWIREAPAL